MRRIMRYSHDTFELRTTGRGAFELTRELNRLLEGAGHERGLATVFLHHTSASLCLCENADPTVLADLERWFARAVPDGDPLFRHTAEGPDDMPAHVRSVLTGNSLSIPVVKGRLDLGTWQGVYCLEHRVEPHRRRVTLVAIGPE